MTEILIMEIKNEIFHRLDWDHHGVEWMHRIVEC